MTDHKLQLETAYGQLILDDPLTIDLVLSQPFQRLKEINQYGVVNFIVPTENYSRFDHSIGVYHLLKKQNRPRNELLAGLLHDVSHTVFSHVGDYVFEGHRCYQDHIHLWYLKESGIAKILEKYCLKLEDINHKNPSFSAVDRPLPDLCADRIDYNLQGGFLRNLLTREEFQNIYEALHFSEGQWILDSKECALKLGVCSLVMTETLWGAAWEGLSYRLTAEALRHSFTVGLITFDEFHFSTDKTIWDKLSCSNDPYISYRMNSIKDIHSFYSLTDHGKEDILLKLKFRGINPFVRTAKGIFPLTELDEDYKLEYTRIQQTMEKGWAIIYT